MTTTIPFRNFFIHLEFEQVGHRAWMSRATIEDPVRAETSAVAMPEVHQTPHAAGVSVYRLARMRIIKGTWRN
jgi:hypothetical protein